MNPSDPITAPSNTTKHCAMDTREVVNLLADIAGQVESILGEKGAITVFRYAGAQLGKRLGEAHPNGTEEDARDLIAKFFHDKEFMDAVGRQGHEATLSGCKIGLVLQERGITAGKHALCNFGFGLIDGTVKAVTGKKIITLHVESEYHAEGITCKETW
jgi:predicted hydrocarbon binding protein